MMKLLIIYHSGLAEDIKYIFREYIKQGVQVSIIVPQKNGSLVWGNEHNQEAFKYIPLKLKVGYNFFELFLAIKKEKPDVIHVFDEYTSIPLFQAVLCRNILRAQGGNRIPVFCLSFQNLPLGSVPFVFTSLRAFFRRLAYKCLLPLILYYHRNNVDGAVGGNKEALQMIKNVGAKAQIRQVFWGVNIKLFLPKNRDQVREKLGIPKQVTLIGNFGRMLKEKGLEYVLQAMSQLGSNYQLLLIGDGNYKEQLKDNIAALHLQDRVYFLNKVKPTEVSDYYNALDVFVLPSQTTSIYKEQYCRVLVEAMACQLAIVGSSSGAIPEVLAGYPKHLIFKEDSAEDLVEKIKTVQSLEFLENFNHQEFLQKFSVENFVSKAINFYETIPNVR